ncbi:MAG: rod shape-determining protein MreC [Candidatus Pacebacteria bacterium]|nr:rod shape-determining protein MreC [Candidatus Paceibacterota bacterium]
MKNTHFLQPHKGLGRTSLRAHHAFVVIVAFLLVWVSPVWLQKSVLSLGTPFFALRTALAEGAVSLSERFMSRDELLVENNRLREENTHLTIKGALYDELQARVVRLETLLGRAPHNSTPLLAHVLASPMASPHDTFLLDVGSDDGVAPGDTVLFGETMLLGHIELVTEHTARVALFSAPGTETEVSIGADTTRVKAEGQGGGMFLVHVPKDSVLNTNDALIPLGSRAAIGFVQSISSKDTDAFQIVYATMPINLFETREVLVERAAALTE